VDLSHRRVKVSGRTVQLTPTEYDLLKALIQARGRVLTHQQIMHQVWGAKCTRKSHLLRVNISNLRRKLEAGSDRPTYILTEPWVGYRLWMGEMETQAE
jgi:two-component system KDP operon response regulator KdpE